MVALRLVLEVELIDSIGLVLERLFQEREMPLEQVVERLKGCSAAGGGHNNTTRSLQMQERRPASGFT